jgi:CheY-like chemotaxis protein/DNA-binding XRE family transcriptional regulator
VAKKSNASNKDNGLQAHLGATIRKHRKQLGITQEELAWRADLHRTYIADIERGGRNVTLRSIANLAKALRVSVDALLSTAEEGRVEDSLGDGYAGAKPGLGEVLLVEDSPADVELTLRAFKLAKFANPVRVVRDGEEALEYLWASGRHASRQGEVRPQLVLLDLMLPGISGIEVLRRLRDHELTRSLPVVVLTGSRQDRNIIECARLGASNYLIKPVSFDTFCEVTSRLHHQWVLLRPGEAKCL